MDEVVYVRQNKNAVTSDISSLVGASCFVYEITVTDARARMKAGSMERLQGGWCDPTGQAHWYIDCDDHHCDDGMFHPSSFRPVNSFALPMTGMSTPFFWMNTVLDFRFPFHGGDRCRICLEAAYESLMALDLRTPILRRITMRQ